MEYLHDATTYLVGAECADTMLVEQDFLNASCLKLLVSKGLGIAIVGGSVIRSAEGLSIAGAIMEHMTFAFALAYNVALGNPFR
eukprot:UC1_evm1s383